MTWNAPPFAPLAVNYLYIGNKQEIAGVSTW